jgi:toxin FitB
VRYLLDTNVLSEPMRPTPAELVVAWLAAQAPSDLAISALTLGELTHGVMRLADGRRRRALVRWVSHDLAAQFRGRVLDVTPEVAMAWGELSAEARARGRPLPVVDGLLLATAKVHDLTLVTRNLADCAGRGVEVLSPWRD